MGGQRSHMRLRYELFSRMSPMCGGLYQIIVVHRMSLIGTAHVHSNEVTSFQGGWQAANHIHMPCCLVYILQGQP